MKRHCQWKLVTSSTVRSPHRRQIPISKECKLSASQPLPAHNFSTSSSSSKNSSNTKNTNNNALNYLETWVGGSSSRSGAISSNNRNKHNDISNQQLSFERIKLQTYGKSRSMEPSPSNNNNTNNMHSVISNNNIIPSSYSIPTFKLYKNDPIINTVLNNDIENNDNSNNNASGNSIKSVVLDLSDFNPNGLPHQYNNTSTANIASSATDILKNSIFLKKLIIYLKIYHSMHIIGITLDSIHIPTINNIANDLSLSFFRRKNIIQKASSSSLSLMEKEQKYVTNDYSMSSNEIVENDNNDDSHNNINSSPLQQQQPPLTSKIIKGPIRSGQQIYIKNTNIIVLGSVHSGGEILSDGDLYVYGKLNGRAFAGLSSENNNDAKIITTNFNPELLCIGSTFTTIDDVDNDDNFDCNVKNLLGCSVITFIDSSGKLKFENISM